jgi:hypothetical protein
MKRFAALLLTLTFSGTVWAAETVARSSDGHPDINGTWDNGTA